MSSQWPPNKEGYDDDEHIRRFGHGNNILGGLCPGAYRVLAGRVIMIKSIEDAKARLDSEKLTKWRDMYLDELGRNASLKKQITKWEKVYEVQTMTREALEEQLIQWQERYQNATDEAFKEGMERAAEMLDLNYPLCAKWIRKEIDT